MVIHADGRARSSSSFPRMIPFELDLLAINRQQPNSTAVLGEQLVVGKARATSRADQRLSVIQGQREMTYLRKPSTFDAGEDSAAIAIGADRNGRAPIRRRDLSQPALRLPLIAARASGDQGRHRSARAFARQAGGHPRQRPEEGTLAGSRLIGMTSLWSVPSSATTRTPG